MTLGLDMLPERIAYARELSKLPVVLSADEVVRFLEAIPNLKSRTALTMVYAAGLRVSEVVLLKVADIDSQRMVIRVEQGKGGKDRYVMLSPQLLRILRTYWRLARPKRWLFPGRDEERPLVPNALHAALPLSLRGGWLEQAGYGAHLAAHIRDPSLGERGGRAHHPKYSPDLNPIEQFFAKLKHWLRKAAQRTTEAVYNAIGPILDTVSSAECANYFANAGYDQT